MTYTLFVWSLITIYGHKEYRNVERFYEWRQLAVVAGSADNCAVVASELGISKEKYRCIRTK